MQTLTIIIIPNIIIQIKKNLNIDKQHKKLNRNLKILNNLSKTDKFMLKAMNIYNYNSNNNNNSSNNNLNL